MKGGDGADRLSPPLVLAAAAAGPLLVVLHETRTLSIGPAASLWPVAFVVLGAALGLVATLRLTAGPHRLARVLALLPNALVLAGYGFLLAFFGLGGSR